ncbi:beta-glucanase (GH16 family) [Kribbella sp. VKM Ac-2569]|uniref:golvesin C-terminal-like domain-containing protein n=1 Tax=Kribbella sp. VKM Ac-2569 TaxID=2512220 RepID=UPI00102AA99D|nr:family 16 glycosylhydrolase [Kribbella sp. VKM Ac-2569]RZT07562.1 beta-glucanase (GH16 family) [Kribbella sp. VKM Ac-2569]
MTIRRSVRLLASLTLITTSALVGTGVADAEPAPGPNYVPAGYQLGWADEFAGTTLNTNDWYHREGEKAICANRPGNVSVNDGTIHIALKRETYQDKNYTCGGIISRQTFGYGYYETRAKLWGDKGFHSAFWQMGLADYVPDTPSYKGPYNRFNEIDGFEIDSHAPTSVQQHSHWTVPQHIGNQGGVYTGPDSSDGYHTYGYEWLPNEIRFYVDGVLSRTLAYPGPHALQNVWLTTLGYTEPVDETRLPGETTWDYFRYYKPIGSADDIATGTVLVDNCDPGYAETGTWTGVGEAYGYQDKLTRRAGSAAATATWTPSLPSAQTYEVYAWNPDFIRSGSTAARYSVSHTGGTTDVVIDQTKAGQQWIDLGSYAMTPGAGHKVQVAGSTGATGTLRTDAVKFVPTVVIDNGGSGYTEAGPWTSTTTVKGWRGTDTRYSSTSTSTARWTPQLPAAGRYDVYAWVPGSSVNVPTARYTINSADGVGAPVDPAESMGVDRWVRLGNYQFGAGATGWVELSKATGEEGYLRADAVKFVPAAAPDAVAPATPINVTQKVKTTPSTGDAVLTLGWTPVPGADVIGHHVYLDGRRQTANPVQRGSFELHELLAGQTYQLSVTAVDRSGNESPASQSIAVPVPADTIAPATPTGLVGEAADGRAVLYWSQNSEVDLLGYNIYADGTLVTTDEPVGNIGNPDLVKQGIPVPDLANNVAHSLQVRAVDLAGNESAPATVSVTPTPMTFVGVADSGYTETGVWAASSVPGWLTSGTRASNGAGKTAEWRPDLPSASSYDVYAWVPNHSNSTAAAHYVVSHATGSSTIDIDQRSGGNRWILLGRYQFNAGTAGYVTISNPSATGYLRTSYTKFVPAS